MRAYAALALATLLLAACHPDSDKAPVAAFAPDPDLKADLAKAAGLRVFFGHQSVGGNIVDGLQELRALAGDTALHVIHDPAAAALPPAFFAEAKVGKNGDPLGKLAAFKRVVDSTSPGRLDLALVKISSSISPARPPPIPTPCSPLTIKRWRIWRPPIPALG